MKIYKKYILKEFITHSIFFYFIFNFLFIFLKLVDFSDRIINGSLSFFTALYLSLLLVPSFSIFTIPLVCLSSVLTSFSKLSLSNEVVALKSFGVSTYNLMKISLFFGFSLFLLGVLNNIYIVPISSKIFSNEVKNVLKFTKESLKPSTFNSVLSSSIIYFKSWDKNGKMNKIFIYDRLNGKSPETIVAEKGLIDIDHNIFILNLTDGNIYMKKSDEMEIISFKTYNLKYDIAKELAKFNINLKDKESSISEIKKRIKFFQKKGDYKKVNYLLMEIYKRISFPFASIIFAVLGLIFGIENKRNPNSWTLFILFTVVFVYYSLIMASSYLVKNMIISAFLGSWIPNVIGIIVSFLLYKAKGER